MSKVTIDTDDYIPVQEAADKLGVHIATINAHIRQGELMYIGTKKGDKVQKCINPDHFMPSRRPKLPNGNGGGQLPLDRLDRIEESVARLASIVEKSVTK